MNDERSCATCAHYGEQDYCEDCESKDLWNPKEESVTISVNGGPAVPFPSPEATEQVTEMVKGHLDKAGVVPTVKRSFIGKHILEEFEDGTVSLDYGPRVTRESMQAVVDTVTAIKGDGKPKQVDLDGNPLPEVSEDTEEETRTFIVLRHNAVTFRMSDEAYEKLVESKLTDGVGDRKDRILRAIQNKAKIVLPAGRPIDHGAWDAATEAIYKRVLEREGLL